MITNKKFKKLIVILKKGIAKGIVWETKKIIDKKSCIKIYTYKDRDDYSVRIYRTVWNKYLLRTNNNTELLEFKSKTLARKIINLLGV